MDDVVGRIIEDRVYPILNPIVGGDTTPSKALCARLTADRHCLGQGDC
jgi:hypothetical protein